MEENPEDGTVCELKETELLDGTKERLSFESNYRFTDCLGDLENPPPPQVSRWHLHCQDPLLPG